MTDQVPCVSLGEASHFPTEERLEEVNECGHAFEFTRTVCGDCGKFLGDTPPKPLQ